MPKTGTLPLFRSHFGFMLPPGQRTRLLRRLNERGHVVSDVLADGQRVFRRGPALTTKYS